MPEAGQHRPYAYTGTISAAGSPSVAEAIFWATDYLTVESGSCQSLQLFVTFAF
jgi:hypothetical protein